MKKYVLTLFALILLAGTSCQEKIDIEKEKEAVKTAIESLINDRADLDYDGYMFMLGGSYWPWFVLDEDYITSV